MPRILYVQYTNPAGYPPLEHSSRMLADAGWEVLFLGTGALGAGALRFPQHLNIEVRQMPVCRAVTELLEGRMTLQQAIVTLLARPRRDE